MPLFNLRSTMCINKTSNKSSRSSDTRRTIHISCSSILKYILVVTLSTEVFLFLTLVTLSTAAQPLATREYLVVGVSGGLQDGFPEHFRLDYHSGERDEVQAIFLGRALVRGYKAFLDVMEPGWRQYSPEPHQPLINSNVFASGCHEHANEYWIYLVDSRQVMMVLNNEPRFLSITPDTGQIDLDAKETNPLVKAFFQHEIDKLDKRDMNHVAIPLVTAIWFQPESHVPSPILYTHKDGTQVTNFPESLALWAGVNDTHRTAFIECNQNECTPKEYAIAKEHQDKYWNGIRQAIRNAEEKRPSKRKAKKYGPPFKCKKQVRFGVSNDTARVNYPFSVQQVTESLKNIGYSVDYEAGKVYQGGDENGGSKSDEL